MVVILNFQKIRSTVKINRRTKLQYINIINY